MQHLPAHSARAACIARLMPPAALHLTVTFSTYMAITVHLQPQWAFSLPHYMSIVAGLDRRVKGRYGPIITKSFDKPLPLTQIWSGTSGTPTFGSWP